MGIAYADIEFFTYKLVQHTITGSIQTARNFNTGKQTYVKNANI